MNFIFDIGNVLVSFKPMAFLNDLFPDNPFKDKIYETIFMSHEWQELDRGVITHEEACDIFRLRRPEIASDVLLAMEHLEDMLTPLPESAELLPVIKKAGHKMYYLSNYHKKLSDFILNKYSFFKLFDGGVFSCDVHINKPSVGIYRALLEKYSLNPRDSVFFDDTPENVEAGEREGIKSIVFKDTKCINALLDMGQDIQTYFKS